MIDRDDYDYPCYRYNPFTNRWQYYSDVATKWINSESFAYLGNQAIDLKLPEYLPELSYADTWAEDDAEN